MYNSNSIIMKKLCFCFYVFDLLILAVMVFSINHAMTFQSWWPIIFLDIALLLRLTAPFLLCRGVRWRILPIVAFTAIFGYFVLTDAFHNVIYRMALYPGVILHKESLLKGGSSWSGLSNGELLVWCVIVWTWLMPLLVYVIQFSRDFSLSIKKRTVSHEK